jgi:hypothetical protein
MTMKIVGSRSGGHEYYLRFSTGDLLWMGQHERSDWDAMPGEPQPGFDQPPAFPQFQWPVLEDGVLTVPETFDFFNVSATFRLSKAQRKDLIVLNKSTVVEVLDRDKNTVGEFFYEPQNLGISWVDKLLVKYKYGLRVPANGDLNRFQPLSGRTAAPAHSCPS